LACKLLFDHSETGIEQSLEIRAFNSRRELVLPLFGLVVVPKAGPSEDEGRTFINFVYNMRDTLYAEPGPYRFGIWTMSHELAGVELRLIRSAPQSQPTDNTLAGALLRGYRVFMAGDKAEAARIFQRLVERFPDSPEARNNLGFTLLADSRASEAANSFTAALSKGPQYPELVQANLAVCHFLMGEYPKAADMFQTLMPQPLRSPGSVLFALGRSNYQLIQLVSPTDYLALMALNASRSALKTGERARAAQLAQVAQAGRITMQGENARVFGLLLDELTADIDQGKTSG
jgi:tetratricopeptide (TPR) repeat protein